MALEAVDATNYGLSGPYACAREHTHLYLCDSLARSRTTLNSSFSFEMCERQLAFYVWSYYGRATGSV